MALPTTNLQLDVIASALGAIPAIEVDIHDTCNYFNVNENGLDPTYCNGYTPSSRLGNLQFDNNMGYFRGYDHTASLSMINVVVSTTSCGTKNSTSIYTIGTLSNAYDGGYNIYLDSGTTSGVTGFYYTWNTISPYYQWHQTNGWVTKASCTLVGYTGTTIESDSSTACKAESINTFWHNGLGTYPVDGNEVYTNSDGSTLAGTGWQKYVVLGHDYVIYINSGVVDGSASECP